MLFDTPPVQPLPYIPTELWLDIARLLDDYFALKALQRTNRSFLALTLHPSLDGLLFRERPTPHDEMVAKAERYHRYVYSPFRAVFAARIPGSFTPEVFEMRDECSQKNKAVHGGWVFPFDVHPLFEYVDALETDDEGELLVSLGSDGESRPDGPFIRCRNMAVMHEMAVSPSITRYTAKNINEGQDEDIRHDWYRGDIKADNPAGQGVTVAQLLRSLKDIDVYPGRMEVTEELKDSGWPRALAYHEVTGLAFGVGGALQSCASVFYQWADPVQTHSRSHLVQTSCRRQASTHNTEMQHTCDR